jgi:hypothetical protein
LSWASSIPSRPSVVAADEPEDLRGQLAARIEPERLGHRADPGQPGGADGLGRHRRDLDLHPHERPVAGQALLDVPRPLAEVGCQRGRHGGPVGDLPGSAYTDSTGAADGEGVAVPIEDRTSLRPERDRLRVLPLGEPGEIVVADDLEVSQPDDYGPEEEDETAGQDERAASIAGHQTPSWCPDEGGCGHRGIRFGRMARPSGCAPTITATSPWPVEPVFPGAPTTVADWPARVMK